MQAAWEQVGDVLAAERAFSLARLSRDVLKRVEIRHLAKLPPERAAGGPRARACAHPRRAGRSSLYGRIERATLPDELFDGAMRRLTSARRADVQDGAMARAQSRAAQSVAAQMAALVDKLRQRVRSISMPIDPEPLRARRPDGQPLVRQRSPLPGDLDDRGRPGAVHRRWRHDDRRARSRRSRSRTPPRAQQARRDASASRRRSATSGAGACITETHALRFAELRAARRAPLDGDIGTA